MPTNTVFEKLVMMLTEGPSAVNPEECTPETNLITDLGLDSLDVIDLAMSIELEFNMVISDVEVEKWRTIQDVVDCVHNNI
jgi:acyl carrier protein